MPIAVLLHLLAPGMGHVLWREYLFGLFVFLILLTTSALTYLSFLVPLPIVVKLAMFGLPLTFYIFSFFDLGKTVRNRRSSQSPSRRLAIILFALGLAYQLLSPTAAGNFLLRNRPLVYTQPDNSLSPVFGEGDLLTVNRLTYSVDFLFTDQRIAYRMPERFDFVRYHLIDDHQATGLVIGLPGEQVEVLGGTVVVNNVPHIYPPDLRLGWRGDCPLTGVDPYGILVAEFQNGRLERVHEVSLAQLIGRVSRLF